MIQNYLCYDQEVKLKLKRIRHSRQSKKFRSKLQAVPARSNH